MKKYNPNDTLTPELKRILESNDKTIRQLQPILREQERVLSLIRPVNVEIAENSGIEEAMKSAKIALENDKIPSLTLGANQYKFPTLEISKSLLESIERETNKISLIYNDTSLRMTLTPLKQDLLDSISSSMQGVLNNFSSAIMKEIQPPILEWLNSIDLSPLTHILDNLRINRSELRHYRELRKVYLRTMYDAKWFPYAGWLADLTLFAEVNTILNSSRGMSKRCEKRIDKAIISHYSKSEISRIGRRWKTSEIEPHIKRILKQVINAYMRKEYALVVSPLATMWDGIIRSKFQEDLREPKKKFTEKVAMLVDGNGYDEVFSDFYNNMIIGTCYKPEDVVEGIPNRHGIAHCRYIRYPSQKAALNAILLTDFLINLESK